MLRSRRRFARRSMARSHRTPFQIFPVAIRVSTSTLPTVIAWAVKNNPQLELSYLYSTGLVWAAPLRKDSGELRKALDVAVECMKLDGTIARMHEKWFGVAPAAGSAAVTVFPGYGVPDMPGYDPTAHTPSCS